MGDSRGWWAWFAPLRAAWRWGLMSLAQCPASRGVYVYVYVCLGEVAGGGALGTLSPIAFNV